MLDRDPLEVCITYLAPDVAIGVRQSSIQFVGQAPPNAEGAAGGHIKLEPNARFYVNTEEFGVGRSATNDLVVDNPKISRSHLKILVGQDNSYHVQDLGSANGTMLDGKPLEKYQEYHLRSTGEIQLAGILHMTFTDFGATYVTPEVLTVYGLSLSHSDRSVWMQGQEEDAFKLSSSEYKFLSMLMENYPNHVTHGMLTQALWDYNTDDPDDEKRSRDALFNIAKRLRDRLQIVDPDYEYVETVRKWGNREGGYKFNKH
ncbi:MAG: FHA domain-containing protein [Caldilineaceae bacterium]|nr:FHA domain-containing protein [Caldilineaceae bacterium]MCB0096932.1 FHA domain-containing protein [Caldilineaceae bacterium]MCB0139532.1 FHA domain-containing protein [Caldilineaceae bacterium]MCB9150539.1 FHA domain-containing protein [Caldilineaceae bacterium]